MDELIKFLQKEKHKKFLELFMMIEEVSRKEDIISFSYENDILMIKTGEREYYRITINKDKEV